ncbi:hypothetical protein A3C96_02505 [Candidatus Uhrbacteria bacterium RIFCSPHIGHO2_02_FULL_60_10]|uniref:Aminoglycoside phosphotransferase domain-containing protein n=1 Tax=Candidatus Uhrbacteria bacterium RIFCSPHIGHO2_02_FULL_60_10 TaxID=1802392 RepID=A0A1F7U3T3_9BACT|nr:MAG: hypothetical protein A3C96_02505 [Candidatus Uhrbacteria bacterium RIFCSPHIGHO2_02_FULL_60_10]
MELAMPPLHPKVPALLKHLNLRILDAIKWNVIAVAPADDPGTKPKWVLKFGDDPRKAKSVDYEIRILREVLPGIDQSEFERLVLPQYADDGTFEEVRWVKMDFVPGRQLVYEWSEINFKPEVLGGRGIEPQVAAMAVDMLRDLRSVDIESMPKAVRRFDFAAWLDDFRRDSGMLVGRGFMEEDTIDRALQLFTSKRVLRYEGSMFTNTDFYPRNFVIMPDGRHVSLVDWVGGVDPWEFVAMRAWLLMWGNPRWQIAYTKGIKEHFPVDVEEMRIGLLVGAFGQAYRWREMPEETVGFARTQMLAYFRQCLDLDYVNSLFS